MTIEEIQHLRPGKDMDRAVGLAIGAEPKITHIVTSDGGESARAMADARDGPWYDLWQLKNWLAVEQENGLHLECTLGRWESWPKYSTDTGEAFNAARHMWRHRRELLSLSYKGGSMEWIAEFRRCRQFGVGRTEAIAICRAVLMADKFHEGRKRR